MELNKSHVNPNCYDPRFCLPHGEIGEVKYDVERIFAHIRELETYQKKLAKKIEKKMAGNVYSVSEEEDNFSTGWRKCFNEILKLLK